MIHFADSYSPPKYKICCTQSWVEPDFDKDVSPLDDIFVATNNVRYTPVEEYVNCSKCLESIRSTE
jgi:hypothetical protein